MADGPLPVTPSTAANLVDIDNSLFGAGSTLYRQRVVIGDDVNSTGFAGVTSGWPSSADFGLKVRIIGSSGIVLGTVTQSSNWNISTGAVVGLTTTATVGLTTTSLVGLSSAASNYVTLGPSIESIGALSSGSKQFGILGPSSANVVGLVGQSSNWNISTGAVVGLTTTAVVGLTTTSVVGLTTTSIVNLSSALANYVTSSTTVPVYLGASTSNIVGIVGLSSAVTLSSGLAASTASIGVLGSASGTVIGLVGPSSNWSLGASSAVVIGLVGPSSNWSLGASSAVVVGSVAPSSQWTVTTSTATSVLIFGQSSDGATDPGQFIIVGGISISTTLSTAVAQNKDQQILLDTLGRQVTVGFPRKMTMTNFTNLGTTVETIVAAAATSWGTTGIFQDITSIVVSNASTDTPTQFWLQSSSGGSTAGTKLSISLAANGGAVMNFNPPFPQANSTQNWTGINTVVNTTVYVTIVSIPAY